MTFIRLSMRPYLFFTLTLLAITAFSQHYCCQCTCRQNSISGAEIKIESINNTKTTYSDSAGYFYFQVSDSLQFPLIITVSKTGFYTKKIRLSTFSPLYDSIMPVSMDSIMKCTTALPILHFIPGQKKLTNNSLHDLKIIVWIMNENPGLKISFTLQPASNQKLQTRREKYILKYLHKSGIEKKRVYPAPRDTQNDFAPSDDSVIFALTE